MTVDCNLQCGGVQVWINQGDIILISLREFQDDKADVIVKYTADEARNCASLIIVHLLLYTILAGSDIYLQ